VSALWAYEKQAGIALAENPIAVQLQNCHSVESIMTLLQRETQAFNTFRESDRIMKSIKTTVSELTTLDATTSLGEDAFGLVRQKCVDGSSASQTVVTENTTCECITCCAYYPPMYVPHSSSYVGTLVDIQVDQAARDVISSWTRW